MNSKFLSLLISLNLVLLLPIAGFARDIDPDQALTSSQKSQVSKFSKGYADLKNAIEARISNAVDLRSPEAKSIYENLKNCQIIERADGDLMEISGDSCEVSYELFTLTRDLGLNESGDPITEVEQTEYFLSKSARITNLTGFVNMNAALLDHNETLISTPSYVTISTGHMSFTTPQAQEIVLTTRGRLYTNMENEDQTFYRLLTAEFPDFAVRFEINAFMDYEGLIKSNSAVLNKQETDLEQLQTYFTKYLLGLEI